MADVIKKNTKTLSLKNPSSTSLTKIIKDSLDIDINNLKGSDIPKIFKKGLKFKGTIGKKIIDSVADYFKKNPNTVKKYEKMLPDTLKKKPGLPSIIKPKSVKNNKLKEKSTSLVPTGKSKTIKETVNPKKIKQNFTLQGKPVDKTIKQTKLKRNKKPSTSLVPTGKKTKNTFSKSKIPLGIGALTTIGTGSALLKKNDSKVNAKEIKKETKKVTPTESTKVDTSKITKPTTAKVKKQTLPQTKANDYTGKYIDKEGNVAYESFSDFIAHMTGKPKKRAMPEKTKRMIGEGKKLKRIKPETKGAGKGVKYKAFKAGTKDKTVGLKPLPPKSKNPGIHKLPAKTKMNMGFKPMFSGGFISSLYDKPEKAEKYKGNTSAGRQVKGYGKARKR